MGEDDIELLLERDLRIALNHLKSLHVCLNQISGKDPDEAQILIQVYVDNEINPNGLGNLKALFMARIPVQDKVG